MIIEDDCLVMRDGSRYYANRGIVGLSPEGEFFGGYDNRLDELGVTDTGQPLCTIPAHHALEVAEHMAKEWSRLAWDLRVKVEP